MLLYLLLIKVIFYCNFVTCTSLLTNTGPKQSHFTPAAQGTTPRRCRCFLFSNLAFSRLILEQSLATLLLIFLSCF